MVGSLVWEVNSLREKCRVGILVLMSVQIINMISLLSEVVEDRNVLLQRGEYLELETSKNLQAEGSLPGAVRIHPPEEISEK